MTNINHAYTTHNDLCSVFLGRTLLAIKVIIGALCSIYYSWINLSQAPEGTALEVPRPELPPGSNPKYQIHLKSESEQILVQLINKEKNSDPVIVQVPPPPEIAAAIKRETDILTAATSLSRGIKREPEEAVVAGSVKRTRYEGEISSPVSEDCYGSSSDSITGELAVPMGVNVPVQRDPVSPEYNMANIETADLPGLDDMLSTESKIVRTQIDGYNSNFFFPVFGPLIRLSPPPTEKDYCYNLDNSEGVCDLFDIL